MITITLKEIPKDRSTVRSQMKHAEQELLLVPPQTNEWKEISTEKSRWLLRQAICSGFFSPQDVQEGTSFGGQISVAGEREGGRKREGRGKRGSSDDDHNMDVDCPESSVGSMDFPAEEERENRRTKSQHVTRCQSDKVETIIMRWRRRRKKRRWKSSKRSAAFPNRVTPIDQKKRNELSSWIAKWRYKIGND